MPFSDLDINITNVTEDSISFTLGTSGDMTIPRSEFEAIVNGERSDSQSLVLQMALRCHEVSPTPDWDAWSTAIASAPFKY